MERNQPQIFRKFVSLLIILISIYKSLPAQSYNIILGRPTGTSITISILFDRKTDVYWEYGTVSGSYPFVTEVATALVNTPYEFDFTNLQPDTKYYYRTRYRLSGSASAFSAGTEYTFHTQRAQGNSFSFTIEADEHLYDKKGVRNLYKICLANQAADNPDFMLSLGDIFGDDHYPYTITSRQMDSLHKDYRQYLGQICHSVPFYVCLGNHEGEFDYYLAHTPPENIAVYATLWRKFYYPNPFPNGFYSGNPDVEPYGMGNPENYYSWTWGDALFVILDVYRDQCDTSAKPTNWDWTLGLPQYNWLKNTLENSDAKYKFVFAHHIRGQGRGGVTNAKLFEWGGYEQNGTTYSFATKRPGWAKPIHQLFVDNGVNIFFQGHDHVFAHEVMDGITYQALPMPSDSTYEIGMLANADSYLSDTLDGSGHIRVTVSPDCVKVDYVRAYLPADTLSGVHHNREVAFSYSVGICQSSGINENPAGKPVNIYPNPVKDILTIQMPETSDNIKVRLNNLMGQTLLESQSNTLNVSNINNGIYLLNIKTRDFELNKKVIISK
ncbi:MAG: T9SS type A sorting domain-containing protein [Bacteroidota bacterium]